jgi:VanZ family protein
MPAMPPPSRRLRAAPFVTGHPAQVTWRVLSALLLAAVLGLALAPQEPTPLTLGWDKLNHALAFCTLAFTWRLGFPGDARRWLQLALALLALGGAIEVAQQFVPGRQADWADLFADALGGAIGLSMVAAIEWLVRPAVRPR